MKLKLVSEQGRAESNSDSFIPQKKKMTTSNRLNDHLCTDFTRVAYLVISIDCLFWASLFFLFILIFTVSTGHSSNFNNAINMKELREYSSHEPFQRIY